jgi:hypothetical protein
MHIRTVSVSVAAPRDPVFNFLANIENLPDWATEFCECLELRQGRWWAYTSQGEWLIEADACATTGVIDLRAGPAPDQLGLFPLRVLPLGARGSLVSCTFIQPPGLRDEVYERQYQSLLIEMRGLVRRFGGGKLHPPAGVPQFMELGAN